MRRRNVVVLAPGKVVLQDEELPDVPPGGLLLQTLATGLSAGTELTFVKGDHPGLGERFDTELGLFLPRTGDGETAYPVTRLGYMEVARVAESRTGAFAVGDVVATAYGHATAHVSDPLHEHLVRLPSDLNPLLGVYVAHVGPICANGLLHAAADAVGPTTTSLGDGVAGRRVVVTGAGLIGLVTALFARVHGAEEVVLVEEDPGAGHGPKRLGFEALDGDDPGLVLKTEVATRPGSARRRRRVPVPWPYPGPRHRVEDRAAPGDGRWTWRSTPSPGKRSVWGASSTTTGSRSCPRRSDAPCGAPRRGGTVQGCPRRRSSCCARRAGRSAGTW